MVAQQNEHPELRKYLQTEQFGRPHRYLTSVSSTNDIARRWAQQHAPHGALIWAEAQTQGRGRFGKPWTTKTAENLTFSVILRPEIKKEHVGLIPLMAGLAIAEVLDRYLPDISSLKWPNDVLIDDSKCAGILCESLGRAGEIDSVILGIGVNVNQRDFQGDFSRPPTSLTLQLGHPVDRVPLLANILKKLENQYEALTRHAATLLKEYQRRMALIDMPIHLKPSDGKRAISGVCRGVAEDGGLLIETKAQTRTVYAGEVTTGSLPIHIE